ncbi:energy-coupling factor ABC transporter ATP-binding protein [Raoultibacter phocaeensis]|uniref:energy-coupling factor ABC transporter ATP-binding protein n=1 Tax=Raoultibacter phocaeensis TaxID=2479841 RepID=UPI00111B1775|nr:ABC transporter ATP-binding protein [Raoultibacter phocaeensis]
MKAVLELIRASYVYGAQANGHAVVNDLSLSIHQGEFVAIIGENGAGKTTTSKLMNGLLKPTEGSVLVNGVPTTKLKTSAIAHAVGMLFQDPDRQICQNTVAEELAFGLKIRGLSDEEAGARVARALEDFGFDGESAPFMLSRGERQLLALASVVVCEPDVLILDEPTTGLDYRECMHIMSRIETLNRAGTTVVMISHDMELVFDFAKRVVAMAHGCIVADGAPEAVFRDRFVMAKASLVPPQMIELSLRLSEDSRNKGAFDHVTSSSDMLRALEAAGFEGRMVS